MSGRIGPNSRVTRLRNMIGRDVAICFENSNSYINGTLRFGVNKINSLGTSFTSEIIGESGRKNEGYYITRKEEPALRLYVREIISIEKDEEEDTPFLIIEPDNSKPKRTEHGFHPFWLDSVYANPIMQGEQ